MSEFAASLLLKALVLLLEALAVRLARALFHYAFPSAAASRSTAFPAAASAAA